MRDRDDHPSMEDALEGQDVEIKNETWQPAGPNPADEAFAAIHTEMMIAEGIGLPIEGAILLLVGQGRGGTIIRSAGIARSDQWPFLLHAAESMAIAQTAYDHETPPNRAERRRQRRGREGRN